MPLSRFANFIGAVTRWAAGIVGVVVVATAADVAPAAAVTEDLDGPVVLNAWISHQTIDVIDGPVRVTVRLEVEDSGSGLEASPWLDPMNFQGVEALTPSLGREWP